MKQKIVLTTITKHDFDNMENHDTGTAEIIGTFIGVDHVSSKKKAMDHLVKTINHYYVGYDGHVYPRFSYTSQDSEFDL